VLQLLQDIDVGSYLRHDALAALVGLKAGHPAALRRCVISLLRSQLIAMLQVPHLVSRQSRSISDQGACADGGL
jgi:hypothetical protein